MRPTSVVLILVIVISVVSAVFVENHKAEAHRVGGLSARVNGGDGLRLREGPGAEYRIITVMPHQARVKLYGHVGNWAKVRYLATGQIGWTWLAYLQLESGSTSGGGGSGGGKICLTNYWGEFVCSSDNVGNAIRYWAAQYGLGWWGLAATAACESSFHVYAVNQSSGVSGLFQFAPSTFYAWGGHDLWDPWDQSRIASKMFAAGAASQFSCAILIGWA